MPVHNAQVQHPLRCKVRFFLLSSVIFVPLSPISHAFYSPASSIGSLLSPLNHSSVVLGFESSAVHAIDTGLPAFWGIGSLSRTFFGGTATKRNRGTSFIEKEAINGIKCHIFFCFLLNYVFTICLSETVFTLRHCASNAHRSILAARWPRWRLLASRYSLEAPAIGTRLVFCSQTKS